MSNTATAPSRAQAQAEIRPRGRDASIWGIYATLIIISVIELYSASSHEVRADNVFAPVIRHVMFLAAGLAIMFALERVHFSKFLKWSYWFAGISALAMVYTLINGDLINGARRSFSVFGLFNIQPAEMVKLSVVLMIAAILSKSQMVKGNDASMLGLISVVLVVAIGGALLFTQGLTNTLLFMGISLSMMVIGGVKFKKILMVMAMFAVAASMFVAVKTLDAALRQKEIDNSEMVSVTVPGTDITLGFDEEAAKAEKSGRLATWINRFKRHFKQDKYLEPITDLNQQEQYSRMAQAHSNGLGVFFGNSRETARLPLAFSDYIYAIIVEETGLLGGCFVLILYLWLLARAARITMRCNIAYSAMLVMGMAVFVVFQALCHMAIVTGVFPVSGQPLPLISKGGTSILITSVALGIMLSVSRFAARRGETSAIRQEMEVMPESVTAENSVASNK